MITGKMLARQLKRTIGQPLTLRLFTGFDGTNEESIQEMKGGGYKPREFSESDWILMDNSPATAEADVHEFRFDGSKRDTVVGAYLTQPDGGILWIENFARPLEVGRRGDVIPVRATMSTAPLS